MLAWKLFPTFAGHKGVGFGGLGGGVRALNPPSHDAGMLRKYKVY